MGIFLGLFAIAIIIWQLMAIAWRTRVDFRRNYSIHRSRQVDASQRNLTPPPETRQSISALETLGFHRLGEAEVLAPYIRAGYYWILANANSSVQARVLSQGVDFQASFDDAMLVVTSYPSGMHMEAPRYQFRTITSSIKDAFEYHQQLIAKHRAEHGAPRPITSVADYLRREDMAKADYPAIQRADLLPDVVRLIIVAYGALVCVGLLLSWWNYLPFVPSSWSRQDMLLIAIGLTLPLLPIHEQLTKWATYRFLRDSRKIAAEADTSLNWEPYQRGSTAGSAGSKKGIIIRDEIYDDSARITLERDTPTAPFAITCAVYGWLVHTCYLQSLDKAVSIFEQMKQQLQQLVADIQHDPEDPQISSKLEEFVNRFD